MKLCVLLDNGHGCNTKGKCSPDGFIKEYEWARSIVNHLTVRLNDLGIEVYKITPEETDISLSERVRRVNKKYAEAKAKGNTCILISIHINAAGKDCKWLGASGWTVWVGKNASSKSKELAKMLYEESEKFNLKGNRWVPSCKYWEANYTILTKTNCPAVLTENMFQDNKQDVDYLLSAKGKEEIIQLHLNGIQKFIKKYI